MNCYQTYNQLNEDVLLLQGNGTRPPDNNGLWSFGRKVDKIRELLMIVSTRDKEP